MFMATYHIIEELLNLEWIEIKCELFHFVYE